MTVFFILAGLVAGGLFFNVTGGLFFNVNGEASIGLGIICGLSFIAAAVAKLAQAVERLSETQRVVSTSRQSWSVPDPPASSLPDPPAS